MLIPATTLKHSETTSKTLLSEPAGAGKSPARYIKDNRQSCKKGLVASTYEVDH